jgi:D-alanine-D-alanine ligase
MVSGRAVYVGLKAAGHSVELFHVDPEGVWYHGRKAVRLRPGRGLNDVDVVFPALHGPFGEDGTVQGLLECLDLPYVGPGVLASALCMDKLMFKHLMAHMGIDQADYRAVHVGQFRSDRDGVLERLAPLGLPAFVKPARLGSSFGVTRVASAEQLRRALEVAFEHDELAVVEAALSGPEIQCSLIGNEELLVSEPGEMALAASKSGWLDSQTKFTPGAFNLILPARVPEEVRKRIRELAVKIFKLTGCCGLARVDFLLDGERLFINEVNTMPGLGQTGVFAGMMRYVGLEYPQLLDRLLTLAVERYQAKSRHRF